MRDANRIPGIKTNDHNCGRHKDISRIYPCVLQVREGYLFAVSNMELKSNL